MGGSGTFAPIAVEEGFRYGARLPSRVHERLGPLYFADQDWKKPVRAKYMEAVQKHRPTMATVLDWEHWEQFDLVIDWAEEVADMGVHPVIIPKVPGGVSSLPPYLGDRDTEVVLGFAVGSAYSKGRTPVPYSEFAGWDVHLLGGSPHRQIETYLEMRDTCTIIGVDSNTIARAAQGFGKVWFPERPHWRYWTTHLGYEWKTGSYLDAFRMSCQNVRNAWDLHIR